MSDSNAFDFKMTLSIDASAAQQQLHDVVKKFAADTQNNPIPLDMKPDAAALKAMAAAVGVTLDKATAETFDRQSGKALGTTLGAGLSDGLKTAMGQIETSLTKAMTDALKDVTKVMVDELKTAINAVRAEANRGGRGGRSLRNLSAVKTIENIDRINSDQPLAPYKPKPFLQRAINRRELVDMTSAEKARRREEQKVARERTRLENTKATPTFLQTQIENIVRRNGGTERGASQEMVQRATTFLPVFKAMEKMEKAETSRAARERTAMQAIAGQKTELQTRIERIVAQNSTDERAPAARNRETVLRAATFLPQLRREEREATVAAAKAAGQVAPPAAPVRRLVDVVNEQTGVVRAGLAVRPAQRELTNPDQRFYSKLFDKADKGDFAQRETLGKAVQTLAKNTAPQSGYTVMPGQFAVLSAMRDQARASTPTQALGQFGAIGLGNELDPARRILAANTIGRAKNPDDAAESASRAALVRQAAEDARALNKAFADRIVQIETEIQRLIQALRAGEDVTNNTAALTAARELAAKTKGVRDRVREDLTRTAISRGNALSRGDASLEVMGPLRTDALIREWQAKAGKLAVQGGLFNSMNNTLNQSDYVPTPQSLNVNALKGLQSAQVRFLAANASMGTNRGTEFDEQSAKNMQRAQDDLLRKQDALRQQLLLSQPLLQQRTLFDRLRGKPEYSPNLVAPQIQSADGVLRILPGVASQSKAAINQNYETALRSTYGVSYAQRYQGVIQRGERPDESLLQYTDRLANGKTGLGEQLQVLRQQGINKNEFTSGTYEARAKAIKAEFEKLVTPLRPVVEAWKQVDGEIQKAVKDTEKLMTRQEKLAKVGASLKQTFRDGLALFGGFSVGYTATQGLRNQANRFLDSEQSQADISSVFQSRGQGAQLFKGAGETAMKYGADLLETAEAAKALAQAGLSVKQALQELDTTLLASKGIGMSIEQVQELQLTIRSITQDIDKYGSANIDWTRSALDRISAVERSYAVTGQDLANSLKLVLPVADNFTDGMLSMANSIDYVNALSTVMIEKMRITGNQAGNVEKLFFSRLTQPNVLKNLQQKFGATIGNAEGTDFLPLDQLITSLGERYAQLKKDNPFLAKGFATELSGGRNVTAITTVLENYQRVADIAAKSSQAFGEAQSRADIATDTLSTTVNRVRTSFDVMFNSLTAGSGIAKGLRVTLATVVDVFEFLGRSTTTVVASLGTFITVGLLARNASLGMAAAMGPATLATTRFGLALNTLGKLGGPVMITLTAVAAALAFIGTSFRDTGTSLDYLNEAFGKLKSPKLSDIPQAQQLQGTLGDNADISNVAESMVQGLTGTRTTAAMAEFSKKLTDTLNLKSTGAEKFAFTKEFVKQFAIIAKEGGYATAALSTKLTDLGITGQNAGAKMGEAMAIAGQIAVVAGAEMQSQINAMTTAIDKMVERSTAAIAEIMTQTARAGSLQAAFDDTQTVNLSSIGQLPGNVGAIGAYAKRMTLEDILGKQIFEALPTLRDVLKDPNASARALNVLQQRQSEAGGTLTRANALSAILEDAPLRNAIGGFVIRRSEEQRRIVRSGTVSGPNFNTLTPEEQSARLQAQIANVFETAKQNGIAVIKGSKEFEAVTKLQALLAKLQGALDPNAGKLPDASTENGKRNREVLASFQKSMFDFVRRLTETLQAAKFDREFAQLSGTGFNEEANRTNLSRMILQQTGIGGPKDGDFVVGRMLDVVQKLNEAEKDATVLGKNLPKSDAKVLQNLDLQKQLRGQIAQFSSGDLRSLFDDAGAKDLQEKLDELLKNIGTGLSVTSEDFLNLLRKAAIKLAPQEARNAIRRESEASDRQRGISLMQAYGDVDQALASPYATPGTRTVLQNANTRQVTALRVADLEAKKKEPGAVIAAIDAQIQTLIKDANQQIAVSALQAWADATKALNQQIKQNIDDALSGVQSLTKDRSWISQILSPQGDNAEEKARNKAKAVGDAFQRALSPITDGVFNRLTDNFYQQLSEKIFNNDTLRGFFGFGETQLQKQQREGATIMGNEIINASRIGAQFYADVFGVAGPGGGDKKDGASKAAKKASRDQMLTSFGVIAGGVIGGTLGTKKGTDGRFANMGANFAATAGGALAGKYLGSTLGSFAGPLGGLVGGILGGQLGKLFDRPTQEKFNAPVVQALESVERTQRETITTIQAQTEALLKPEARLLNLPTGFNIPTYRPGFGGGAAGGNTTIGTIEVNINGSNLSADELQGAVEGAMANVLNKQQASMPRTRRLTSP